MDQAAEPIVSISNLSKIYPSGLRALGTLNLEIRRGEVFALLGPNGAGKSTLINIVCGISRPSTGSVRIGGHDIFTEYRAARSMVGLVPQELLADLFQTVWSEVKYSRALFGRPRNDAYLESILRSLSLWEKRGCETVTLSGGMKRRLMIAKALAHEPTVLFLDEPTAGVDAELRRAMWKMIRSLTQRNVTVILTTHYIQEAEELADRVGLIRNGEIILVEEKDRILDKLCKRSVTVYLQTPLAAVPTTLEDEYLELSPDGGALVYAYDLGKERKGIGAILNRLIENGIRFDDIETRKSTLEDIMLELMRSHP